jgi:hypothetical protein
MQGNFASGGIMRTIRSPRTEYLKGDSKQDIVNKEFLIFHHIPMAINRFVPPT